MLGGGDVSNPNAEVVAVELEETGGVDVDPSMTTEVASRSDWVLLSHDSTVDADRESSWSSADCSLVTERDPGISSATACFSSPLLAASLSVSCLKQ